MNIYAVRDALIEEIHDLKSLPLSLQEKKVHEVFSSCIRQRMEEGMQLIRQDPSLHAMALRMAVFHGLTENLIRLTEKKPIDKSLRGFAVMIAAENCQVDCLLILLASGDISSKQRGRALYLAACRGYAEVVRLLINPSDPLPAEELGQSLFIAARDGFSDIVDLLLQDGGLITDRDRGHALIAAVEKGHESIIDKMLGGAHQISKELRSRACHTAILVRNFHLFEKLLHATPVIAQDYRQRIYLECVQSLNERALSLCLDSKREIPQELMAKMLLIAIEKKHEPICMKLIEKGLRVSSELRARAYVMIVKWGSLAILKFLFDQRFPIEPSQLGQSMMHAAECGHHEVIEWLLTLEGEISSMDRSRAILAAVAHRHSASALLLMKNFQIGQEHVPQVLFLAADQGAHPVVAELISTGQIRLDRYRIAAMFIAARRLDSRLQHILLEGASRGLLSDLLYELNHPARRRVFSWMIHHFPEGEFRRRAIEAQLYRCCQMVPVKASLREHFLLPSFPADSGLPRVLEALDALDLSDERVLTEPLLRSLQQSAVGRLIQEMRLKTLSEAQFSALNLADRERIFRRLKDHGIAMMPASLSYFHYRHAHLQAQRIRAKLEEMFFLGLRSGERRKISLLGMPNPQTHPLEWKQWLKNIYTQMGHIYYVFRRSSPEDQEMIVLRVLECLDQCASQFQAGIAQLFEQLVVGEVKNPLMATIIPVWEEEHQKSVKSLLTDEIESGGTGVHLLNHIRFLLSAYSFQSSCTPDALPPTDRDDCDYIEDFKEQFDLKNVIEKIRRKLSHPLSLKETFLTVYLGKFPLKPLPEPTVTPLEMEEEGRKALRELASRWISYQTGDRCALHREEALWAQAYRASERDEESSKGFIQFVQDRYREAMDRAIRSSLEERKIETGLLKLSPLRRDGSIKTEAIIRWLVELQLIAIDSFNEEDFEEIDAFP